MIRPPRPPRRSPRSRAWLSGSKRWRPSAPSNRGGGGFSRGPDKASLSGWRIPLSVNRAYIALPVVRISTRSLSDARFTHSSHCGSAGNPIRRLRPAGQWTCWRTCWRHGGARRLALAGALAGAITPLPRVAVWVTYSSGLGRRLLRHHRARPGRLASACRGRGAAKCARHAGSGRNGLRFHQRSARAG